MCKLKCAVCKMSLHVTGTGMGDYHKHVNTTHEVAVRPLGDMIVRGWRYLATCHLQGSPLAIDIDIEGVNLNPI